MQENIRPLSQEEFQQFAGNFLNAGPSFANEQTELLLAALEPLSLGEMPNRAWFPDLRENALIITPQGQEDANIAIRRWRDAVDDIQRSDTPAGRAAHEISALIQARRTVAMQGLREAATIGFDRRIAEMAHLDERLARLSAKEVQNISISLELPDKGIERNKYFRTGPGIAILRFPSNLAVAIATYGRSRDRRDYGPLVSNNEQLATPASLDDALMPERISEDEWHRFVALSALTLSEFNPFPWADRLSTLPGRVILTAVQNAIKHIKDNAGSSW